MATAAPGWCAPSSLSTHCFCMSGYVLILLAAVASVLSISYSYGPPFANCHVAHHLLLRSLCNLPCCPLFVLELPLRLAMLPITCSAAPFATCHVAHYLFWSSHCDLPCCPSLALELPLRLAMLPIICSEAPFATCCLAVICTTDRNAPAKPHQQPTCARKLVTTSITATAWKRPSSQGRAHLCL